MSSPHAHRGIEEHLTLLKQLLAVARPQATMGLVLPAEARRVEGVLSQIVQEVHELERALTGKAPAQALDAYSAEIDRFNAGQPNTDLLQAIRAYNHTIIDALHAIQPLGGRSVLDVGASPHGYALEHALALGAASYTGIGLDVDDPVEVRGPAGFGVLRNEDAERLSFADESFDLIVSMSTFEHVAHVDRVLAEMHRVLKPGGRALVTFEPIWTSSYGHHLHHFGPVASCVPDWSHLIWSKAEMHAALAETWPRDAALSFGDALAWVYDGQAINRIGLREMRDHFVRSPLSVEWITPLMDAGRDPDRLARVSRAVGLTHEELMTKGLSVLLART